MKPTLLWECSAITPASHETFLASWLETEFHSGAVSLTDARTGRIRVSVYASSPPGPRSRLESGFARWLVTSGSPPMTPAAFHWRIRRLSPRDWTRSWKRHFHPLSFGPVLLVRASWHKARARPGQRVVVLDPGLSFGTGHHPTTSFCLAQIVRETRKRPGAFLDVGTGSGLLAIAAAKLGCSPVEAWDHDPDAVRVAERNALRNRVADRIRVRHLDVTQAPRPVRGSGFDLVCANLLYDLLVEHRHPIAAQAKASGTLVLAGILRAQFAEVVQAYAELGFKLITSRAEREWRSGTFRRP
jgi:ribosomal protein L11 methyltransferase